MSGEFAGRAEDYAAARSGYPQALFDWLEARVPLAGARAADIGCGTGKFTEGLLSRGAVVYALDPDAQMLEKAMARLLREPGFYPRLGRAERTGLPAQSLDIVTCASAFHWLDAPAFARECRRLLRPGGKVLLAWLAREEEAPLCRDLGEVLRAFCPAFTGLAHGLAESLPRLPAFFAAYETASFAADARQDEETFVRRVLSSSYAPRPADETYAAFTVALRARFARHAQGGFVTVPTRAVCFLGEPVKGEDDA